MPDLSNKMQAQREKLYVRAYAVLCTVLFLVMGFYTYNKWLEYRFVRTAVEKNQALIEVLRSNAADEKAVYETNKDTFDTLGKSIEQKLTDIFPGADNYTALVMQLDAFEEELNRKGDPFEVSNIDFSAPTEDETAAILPVRMNIRASSKNFERFLQLVENSGALDNQVRLMDINSIRLSFEGGGDGGGRDDRTISFAVQINAYFQKTN